MLPDFNLESTLAVSFASGRISSQKFSALISMPESAPEDWNTAFENVDDFFSPSVYFFQLC